MIGGDAFVKVVAREFFSLAAVFGLAVPRPSRFFTTVGRRFLALVAIVGVSSSGLTSNAGKTGTKHADAPLWFSTTSNFFFTERFPSAVFTSLQHTTELSSDVLPSFESAWRCSTLACPSG